MEFQKYVDQNNDLQELILSYIDCESNDEKKNYDSLTNTLISFKLSLNRLFFKEFLHLVSNIINNHHRTPDFFSRIEKILIKIKPEIIKAFDKWEIYVIFENNQRILLFFINQNIITMDENMAEFICSGGYEIYFYPEIKSFLKEEITRKIAHDIMHTNDHYLNVLVSKNSNDENDEKIGINDFKNVIENYINDISNNSSEKFNEKRLKGENDSYLSELIRNDSIEEFVIFQSQANFSFSLQIKSSIFETNLFLKNREPKLIEYATFYGSLKIFNYLRMNDVQLESSLWLYAIHGRSAEIIHILEDNHVSFPSNKYKTCFEESIKCYHNEITDYFQNCIIEDNNNDLNYVYALKHVNYTYFPKEMSDVVFYNAIKYNLIFLVDVLLKEMNININAVIILKAIFSMQFLNQFFVYIISHLSFEIRFSLICFNDIKNQFFFHKDGFILIDIN